MLVLISRISYNFQFLVNNSERSDGIIMYSNTHTNLVLVLYRKYTSSKTGTT